MAGDVILAKISAGLHFDQNHWEFPRVFHPVFGPQRDVDRLVFSHQTHVTVKGDTRGPLDHNPVFRPVVMAMIRIGCVNPL
jgi:hypothetical protein